MKSVWKCLFLFLILSLLPSANCFAGYEYKPMIQHKGGDIAPLDAFRMLMKNPKNTFLVDVRTRPEYQFQGHAEGAYNIPFMFFSNNVSSRGYKFTQNPDFVKNLLTLFNPKTDTLLIYCKSGARSIMALNAAFKAGFPESKIYSIMGGFEGEINTNQESIYYGKPYYGGWIREGLPWTYKMDTRLMYQPDIINEKVVK